MCESELFTKERKQTAHVIDSANYIEFLLKEIITRYIKPHLQKNRKFVKTILLNNSIINLNGKIKLLLNICADIEYEADRNALIRIAQIRNAFAHNYSLTPSSVKITNKGKNGFDVKVDMVLESVESSGKFETVKREDALEEFDKKIDIAEKQLKEIKEILAEIKE